MERRKLTKEDIDKVRNIEGFPIGKDEDIIALSDAPYYTACPNPFIADFIKENGKPYDEATDDYHREPFAADVSEGKNDPIYTAHTYHTKVPHRAIMQYILHYTNPGDIVFDGFSGSGMTGVAAQLCENAPFDILRLASSHSHTACAGIRYSILNDLSPAASFIAANYNTPIDNNRFLKEGNRIIAELEEEFSWMYSTRHDLPLNQAAIEGAGNNETGTINYTVWSDVFICPHCGKEIVYWDAAVDFSKHEVSDNMVCPYCNAKVSKKGAERAQVVFYDEYIDETVSIAKQVPVRINYFYNGKRFDKTPDATDIRTIERVNSAKIPYWFPTDNLPKGYNTEQPKRSHGVTNVHYFYTKRTQYLLAALYEKCQHSTYPNAQLTMLTSILNRNAYKCNRFIINKYNPNGRINGPKSGTLYIPSLVVEQNIFELLKYKLPQLMNMYCAKQLTTMISTQSSTSMHQIPANSIDYIFTDPPFGENLNYSELSFIWESWLKVKDNNTDEAVINPIQGKALSDYQSLMTDCFSEFFRILKPKRWMTVEFHNSKNAVWNAIQESLHMAGFIIADVRILDKKRASLHQLVAATAVQQDLAITAYKPNGMLKNDMQNKAGTDGSAWEFTTQHLEMLPVVVIHNGKIESIAERQAFLLFDRMVAYHIINGIQVPLDAPSFYRGLDDRFLKRDGMYFLPDQVNEYDTARIKNDVEPIQFQLFVTNEKSAIAWLYQQLETHKTYSEIQPDFMRETQAWDKYEAKPELSVLLEENFLQDDEGKWYIPDVTKEADVAKLREKKLLKEFEGYLATKGKLKLFRAEAVRVGFAKLWADKNYKLIVDTAERLPEQIIQEDDKLLMYYDISLGRV